MPSRNAPTNLIAKIRTATNLIAKARAISNPRTVRRNIGRPASAEQRRKLVAVATRLRDLLVLKRSLKKAAAQDRAIAALPAKPTTPFFPDTDEGRHMRAQYVAKQIEADRREQYDRQVDDWIHGRMRHE